MSKSFVTIILALIGLASLLAACDSQPIPPTVNPAPVTTAVTPGPDGQDNPLPEIPTSTPVREVRLLKICTGTEPASLFPATFPSATARSIIQVVYDGPFDFIGYRLEPVILKGVPSFENGEAFFEPLQVGFGDSIVDNFGAVTSLREGTIYRPSGCKSPECAATFSGTGSVQMDSLVVRFELLPDLKWSDGNPLTAQDSEYGYQVAQAVYPAFRDELVRLTRSYRSTGETTLEWRGLPGSQPPNYASAFFSPLPRHAWESIPASDLPASEIASRSPLGWGPYTLEEWVPGESISLDQNPNYFRAEQEQLSFDRITFLFTDSPQDAARRLLAGECDLADEVSLRQLSAEELQNLQSETGITVYTDPGGGWEQIVFGILPRSEDQTAFFSSPQVRQAIAACIDRERIVSDLYPGLTFVPDSLLLPDHPLYYGDVTRHPYDPQYASDLLTSAGWIDHDNDPGTPRQSQGVPGVVDGTSFEITYLASNEAERMGTATKIVSYLGECGIQANLRFEDLEQVYAAGPDGPVFGRHFDAAQLSWMAQSELPCTLYSSDEIPAPYPDSPKGWGGANASGFSDQDFDQACKTRFSTLEGEPALVNASHMTQAIFSEQLPALPLYLHLRIAAARADLCGYQLDPSNGNSLWNIERLDYGEACQP